MSISNSISLSLSFKDPNITFFNDVPIKENLRGLSAFLFEAKLSYDPPTVCPICGSVLPNSIIKYGLKSSRILLPDLFRTQAFLKLHKQRFLCKSCNHTFTTSSPIVDKHCFISNNTRLAISLDAKKKISEKDIASFNHVSHSTVHRLLRSLHSHFKIRKDFLPLHLCFDEFKSVKSSHSHMSFLFLDASNGSIIDILQNRQLAYLKRYFYRFSLKARQMVKTICVDMYSPYSPTLS
ncbi:MAG: transposase [Erysipelotrichaceae bacterium]|nr:transposase [Erysipelotrichaceae bacterium]